MKVKLINVAEYDVKENKVSEVPFSSFVNLCGNVGLEVDDGCKLPELRLFKTMSEFITLSKEELSKFDQDKPVTILQNGQFMVYLKDNNEHLNIDKDASADTEKDKGE